MMFRNQKGGAAVELAIALPLLAIILFGTIDFGLLMYNKQVITNASREGARSAIVEGNQDAGGNPTAVNVTVMQSYCNGRLIDFSGLNNLTVPVPSRSGDYITATVMYDYKHLFGSLDFLSSAGFSQTTTIHGRTVMRAE
jgi:Flp pilus assembly protein TadG